MTDRGRALARRGAEEVTSYNADTGTLSVPAAGGVLTFDKGQRVLTEEQMVVLSPLGIEAGWDYRQVWLFLTECHQRGLDPWQREAYLMRYPGDRYVRHTGIDGFRKRGESTGEYRGRTTPLFCDEDENWREVWPYRDRPPYAAKVGILRAGFDAPAYGVAQYDEYVPMHDETQWDSRSNRRVKTGQKVPTANWRTAAEGGKPTVMLGKCAEAQAWRVAFPAKFGGFYVPEEFDRVRAEAEVEDPSADKRKAAYAAAHPTSPVVVDAEEVPAFTEEDRALFLDELTEQAEVLGLTVEALCERWSKSRDGRDITEAAVDELADHVHRIRPYVLAGLSEQNRADEYAVYAKAPPKGTVHELFGRGPAVPEPTEGGGDG